MRARQLALWVAAVLLAAPLSRAEEPAGAAVRAVAFSPDGKLLATGTEAPGELTLWDLATRKPRWTHREPKAIASLAFAPDGKTLAAACFTRDARLLDVATGQITANLGNRAREVRCVAFSP